VARLTPIERTLLAEALADRLDLEPLARSLDAGEVLSVDEANLLRDAVGDELTRTGVEKGVVNERGIRLDDLIDRIAQISGMWRENERRTYQQLALVPREESFASQEGTSRVQQSVSFLDFVVDGASLRSMAEHAGYGVGFVTPLCRRWVASHVGAAVDQLLRGNGASGEPVDMLVCSVCGDRGCGAVVADVTVEAEQVVWSSWRWMNYQVEGEHIDMPAMRFERGSYEQLVSGAAALVAALPSVETADRRRLLWPWQWGWRLPRSAR
jgi:hypothetical protein